MTKLLKIAAITALITGFANTAQAGAPYAFQDDDYLAMVVPAAEDTTMMTDTTWSIHLGDDEIAELEAAALQTASLELEETVKKAPRIACLLYTSPSPRDRG